MGYVFTCVHTNRALEQAEPLIGPPGQSAYISLGCVLYRFRMFSTAGSL